MVRLIRSKFLMTGAATLLTVGMAASALAQPGPGRRGESRRGGFPGLAALDLTDAQRQQVRDVMQRHREEMQEGGRRLRAAYDAQRNAIETVPVNEGLVRSTSQELAAAQTDMAILQARIHSEVFSLLTPEQQAKAKELKDRRAERMKQRGQRLQKRRPAR
jgi:protein CpxP